MASQHPHKGKTALITGACGGLGRDIAQTFLQLGANVVVCDVNDQLISDFNEKVASAYPECVLTVKCDVTDEAALDELFQQAENKFGRLDYAVNNAGIMDKFDPAGEMDRSMWDRVIAINLTAPAMVTKRAVNMFLKHETAGAIVNIASIAGTRGYASGAAYTASKHGILGLTKNTGVYYAPQGIRCNAIMAGGMNTNIASAFMNGLNMEGLKTMRKTFPEEHYRTVSTEKIAKLVSYLCSEDAEIVNGACWTADGGWTAN
ncbi:putative short chain dehydrogenase/oxidoreductase [Hortaea werneckii]|nr:putative short chain dehydrogenase/oxidoreductase [Hortaea werneckii]